MADAVKQSASLDVAAEEATAATSSPSKVAPEVAPEPAQDEKQPQLKSKSKSSALTRLDRWRLVVMCLVGAALDLSGYYSNWSFDLGVMAPLSSQYAVVAVNSTWTQPDFDGETYHNLSMAICNPNEKSQVPGTGMRMFLFMYCTIGVSMGTLLYTIGLCMKRTPWQMKLATMDWYGNVGKQQMATVERGWSLMLFFTQDFIFLTTLGYYTFSCTSQGTFTGWLSFLQFVNSFVNTLRRIGSLIVRAVRADGWANTLGRLTANGKCCPGACVLILAGVTGAMIVVPIVRFFTVGGASLYVERLANNNN